MRLAALLVALALLASAAVATDDYWRTVPTRATLHESSAGPVLRLELEPDRGTACECYLFLEAKRAACRCAETV